MGASILAYWPGMTEEQVESQPGFTNDDMLKSGLLRPGQAFLTKPFSRDGLIAALAAELRAPAVARHGLALAWPVRRIDHVAGEDLLLVQLESVHASERLNLVVHRLAGEPLAVG